MTKNYILDYLKAHRDELSKKFGVKKIGLFGSYARDEANSDSDIDIAVEIESENSFRSFFNLLYFLEDGLKSKIDLGIEHSLKPIAKERVLKEIIYV
jgi:predicted nucleotidyltransferase